MNEQKTKLGGTAAKRTTRLDADGREGDSVISNKWENKLQSGYTFSQDTASARL